MITNGYKWQARELATAALKEGGRLRASGDHYGAAYVTGIYHALRVLVGDDDPQRVHPAFARIYKGYLGSV